MKLQDFDFRIWSNYFKKYTKKISIYCNAPKLDTFEIIKKKERGESLTHEDFITYQSIILKIGEDDDLELWTGSYDKNDRKIFEGDIVIAYHFGQKYLGIVKFWKNGFMLVSNNEETAEEGGELTYFEKYYYDFEVIGNIHENKELLK
ncbi:YopX family protein [Campylobacter estrildidarum]|uniref:YopX protein domain-containing protein n=1 Tax=Campylobacter estrildidarum TaxID=2510189 RepID=A0A4U7BEV2_9BACT|nr:YopX family protein [Campylobacter estrildidarum]TKX28180.1 hypothetical protein CQA69_08565 [Campylobacter estrildidarum]